MSGSVFHLSLFVRSDPSVGTSSIVVRSTPVQIPKFNTEIQWSEESALAFGVVWNAFSLLSILSAM